MNQQKIKDLRFNKHNNYIREFNVINVRSESTENTGNDNKMIVHGIPIVFDKPTVLFKYEGQDYSEIIDRNALNDADVSQCYFKYNHSDNHVVARVKNGTLKIEIRDDGVHMEAEIANTQFGRDLYELIRTGLIDKMSFAFTIREESFDKETRTWTVRKIDKLYDVAAVAHPAYDSTELYARRFGEVETNRAKEVEALRQQEQAKVDAKRKEVLDLFNNKI